MNEQTEKQTNKQMKQDLYFQGIMRSQATKSFMEIDTGIQKLKPWHFRKLLEKEDTREDWGEIRDSGPVEAVELPQRPARVTSRKKERKDKN